jgi:hypothetical protein
VVVQYRSPSLTSWHGFCKALGPRVCGLYKQSTFVYVLNSLATSLSLPLTRRFDTLSQILPHPLLLLLQSSKTTTTTTTTTKYRHHHRHQDHSPWSDLSPPSTHTGLSSRLLTLLYHHQVAAAAATTATTRSWSSWSASRPRVHVRAVIRPVWR